MKPDKKVCLNCGKEISGKKTYCDARCSMQWRRKQPEQNTSSNTNEPEQMLPEQPNPNTFRESLTKTDQSFYDRAMKDFGEPYYNFNGKDRFGAEVLRKDKCDFCNKAYQTTLALNRYCSYDHYRKSTRV